MAATWIKSVKIRASKSAKNCVAAIIDYVENPDKTDSGRLITSYACDSKVADDQFLLAKKEYEYLTGRDQGDRNVLAYHIRQSFKPNEVSPEEANAIGFELASRFFKNKHAFIVATHVDKSHTHNHIIVNSTTLDCTKKFVNFWGSAKTIRRISDLLCAEHGLSVIENLGADGRSKPSKGRNYGEWLGENKPLSWSEKIKAKIDEILPACKTYEDFIAALKSSGCTVSDGKKYVSVMLPTRSPCGEQKRAIRLKSLGDDYTEEAIRERLAGRRIVKAGSDSGTRNSPSLLIDIQAKIREGKGAGYENWAKVFNLKQAAKTLVFLQEQGIDSYDDLKA